MAFAFVQGTKGVNNGFVGSFTTSAFGSNTTAGNAIIVLGSATAGANDLSSVTDNKGNTYTKQLSVSDGTYDLECWACLNITTGGAGHTVTSNDNSFLLGNLIAQEFTPISSSSALDKTHTATGSGNANLDSGNTATTTSANELLIGMGSISNNATTYTIGSGYSNMTSATGSSSGQPDIAMESQVVSATGAYKATFTSSTNSQNWIAAILTFKDTGGGGGPTPGTDVSFYKSRDFTMIQPNNFRNKIETV